MDLDTVSMADAQKAMNYLLSKSLKELRRQKSIMKTQIPENKESLEMMERILDEAILRKVKIE